MFRAHTPSRSTTIVATPLATTLSRKKDGPYADLRLKWGGKDKETIAPKAMMGTIITHGLLDNVASLLADPTTTSILHALYKACPPGSVVRITGLNPMPAYKNYYGYKLDAFRLTKGTTFEVQPNKARKGAATLKYISDEDEVGATY